MHAYTYELCVGRDVHYGAVFSLANAPLSVPTLNVHPGFLSNANLKPDTFITGTITPIQFSFLKTEYIRCSVEHHSVQNTTDVHTTPQPPNHA